MFIQLDSRDSAITSNLNRLRLVRYWPIGNSFFWLLSFFLGETLVGSEDLRRSICPRRYPRGQLGWAIRISQVNLSRRMFTWVLSTTSLSHPLSPRQASYLRQPLSLSRDSRTEKLPRTEREETRKSPRRSENSRRTDLSNRRSLDRPRVK